MSRVRRRSDVEALSDMEKLGLKPRHMRLIHEAMHAYTLVPNGNHLTEKEGAASDLVERGFLTLIKKLPGFGSVVKLSRANYARMKQTIRKAKSA